jgi:hypothetical protein
LADLKTKYTTSKKTTGNQKDALVIYTQIEENKWISSRIGRYFKSWNKLSSRHQKERKYEAVLNEWAQNGQVPDSDQIDKYVQQLDAEKTNWKSLWKDGVMTLYALLRITMQSERTISFTQVLI